ncbi:hypothetical protein [Serratia silvae]|uniref:Uncharacterized protein n=1 Tax=Serratia silvae TaxID=2824122 RepID=A0ABT0KAY9_9GAMM|nr:hypothetical protein [Serratia silvae]MCL1029157.1 hypothetical protein [Serratia silvae]
MTRTMFYLALPLFIISSSASAITDEPSEKQLLEILFSNASESINNQPYCAEAFSKSGDVSLGSYLAGHIANFAEAGRNIIEKKCDTTGKQWACSISFNHRVPDKEILSNYGVKFNLTSDRKLVKDSIICIGQ